MKNQITNPKQRVNSNVTEAILETGQKLGRSKVSVPPEAAIEDAKDWVDNGSKL